MHQGGRDGFRHRRRLHHRHRPARRSKVRQDWQFKRFRKLLDRRTALGHADREHAGAPDSLDHRTDRRDVGLRRQRAQIQAHCGSLEEIRCGGGASRQLIEEHTRIRRADAHLHQANLAEMNLDRLLARGFGRLVHA